MNALIYVALAGVVAGIAAATDAANRRIPNALTFSAVLAGLTLHALEGKAAVVVGALGVLVTGCLPYALHRGTRGRAIGGGDVKLFAALGALLGPMSGLHVELSAFLLLGLFALLRLAFSGRLGRVLVNAGFLVVNPILPERFQRNVEPEALTEMRLGPAVFVAVLVVAMSDLLHRQIPWL